MSSVNMMNSENFIKETSKENIKNFLNNNAVFRYKMLLLLILKKIIHGGLMAQHLIILGTLKEKMEKILKFVLFI